MKSKLNLVSFIQGPLEVQYEVQTVDHEKKKKLFNLGKILITSRYYFLTENFMGFSISTLSISKKESFIEKMGNMV